MNFLQSSRCRLKSLILNRLKINKRLILATQRSENIVPVANILTVFHKLAVTIGVSRTATMAIL